MSETEIVQARSQEPMQPMQMIQVAFEAAIKQGAAMEVVNVILEQQRWMINHNEEEAFNAALKRIQDDLKSIPKTGWNKETQSHYATSEDVDGAIQSLLVRERMVLSFSPAVSDKPDMVLVVGSLSLGAFSKLYPLEMPADGKGAKGGGVMSRTHATGAAITYAKRYLKNMIFDLRFKEKDDDGNGAGLTVDQNNLVSDILTAESLEQLEFVFKAAFRIAFNANDQKATKAYLAAKEKRKSDLADESA